MKINPSLINQKDTQRYKDTKHRKVSKQKAKKFSKKLFIEQSKNIFESYKSNYELYNFIERIKESKW